MQKIMLLGQKQRFSIRKYSFGAASVLLGASLIFGGRVFADEQVSVNDSQEAQTVTVSQEVFDESAETTLPTEDKDMTTEVSEATTVSDAANDEAENLVTDTNEMAEESSVEEDKNTASVVDSSTQTENDSNAADTQEIENSQTKMAESDQVKEVQTTGTIRIANQSTAGFDIIITDVSDDNGIAAVKIPVWTAAGNQDDIVWYDATKQSDSTYQVTVKASDHKNERGEYIVHLYYVENSGNMVGVSATTTKLGGISLASSGYYTFTEKVPAKSEAKMSAQTEFTFSRGEGINYDRVVDADNYQWISYISYSGPRRYIPISQLSSTVVRTGNISVQDRDNGDFDVVISNVSDSKGLAAVKIPVWTEKSDQDDIIWFTMWKALVR